MFTIAYKDKVQEVETGNEVIDLLVKFEEEKAFKNLLIVIDHEEIGTLEIGLGLEDSRSIVIYTPLSEEEDVKISCNSTIDRGKSPEVLLDTTPDGTLSCTESNLVAFEDAMAVVRLFADGDDIFTKIDWYTYF